MQKHQKGHREPRREPTQRELFLGGKSAEFAVFFNVAFTKLLRTIHAWKTNEIEFDESKLDNLYGKLITEFENGNVTDDLSDEIYSKLRNYIWKGFRNERNSAGYELDSRDKKRIQQLIVKLRDMRNMHSHAYHDNARVGFSQDLEQFIMDLHQQAMMSVVEKHPEEVDFYQKNLLEHPLFKEHRITPEGRTFFLSLFLTTGEVSRLLQKRRGSKNNSELRFRIKHVIYRYYAHRDGAARKYYNLEEGLHDTLSKMELRELLDAQKFYRLNTQINDVPEFIHDVDIFPLYYRDSQGQDQLCETVQDLVRFVQQHHLAPSLTFKTLLKKGADAEEKTGVIRFCTPDGPELWFEMSRTDLHRLVLDLLRLGEPTIIQRLRFFVEERRVLVNALNESEPELHLNPSGTTEYTLLDYEKYKLRGSRRLREDFSEWLMSYDNQHKKEDKHWGILTSRLDTAPIELRHFDLYHEADQKLRTNDRFIEHCVDYLIDFKRTPNWYWAFESFEYQTRTNRETRTTKQVLRRIIKYFNHQPTEGTWRLCVDSDHILVKLADTPDAQPYALGINALRNLMIVQLDRMERSDKAASNIQNLLTRLDSDFQTLKKAARAGQKLDLATLQLLDADTIPESILRCVTNPPAKDWQAKTRSRLEHVIASLVEIKKDKTGMSRANKNEQVMRCYQFFDWNPKFLRQNEYQQLSIYHYSLQRIALLEDDLYDNKELESEARKKGDFRGGKSAKFEIRKAERHLKYFEGLLDAIKAENQKRIPPEVAAVLKKADSLEDLLDRIIETTLVTLRDWLNSMQNGPMPTRETIAQRLKIPLAQQANADMAFPRQHGIPFSVHPALVIKAFLEEKDAAVAQISQSKLIRDNTNLMAALRAANYDYTTYTQYAAEWPKAKQVQRKQVGAYDRTRTHDAIRWLLAGRYFERTSSNLRMAITGENTPPTQVGSLRRNTLNIPITTASGRAVQIELYFHQLDDTLFVESKDLLTRIVDYIYRRRDEQPVSYQAVHDDRLPYGEVVKEMARLQNDALTIAESLLKWERSVLDNLTDAALVQHSEGKSLKRISFKKIGELARITGDQEENLRNLRNTVFHLKVPEKFTFQVWVQQPGIKEILGEVEFKKDRSMYQNPPTQDEKNDENTLQL
jgi:hypothetical protein